MKDKDFNRNLEKILGFIYEIEMKARQKLEKGKSRSVHKEYRNGPYSSKILKLNENYKGKMIQTQYRYY